MSSPTVHSQKVENPRKTAGSLKERAAAVSSPLLSVLANLHYVMAMLMKLTLTLMLLTGAGGMMGTEMMNVRQDFPPWLRRGLLLVALLTASFTLYRLLGGKYTRRALLFHSLSLLFTAGMITWSIATFGL